MSTFSELKRLIEDYFGPVVVNDYEVYDESGLLESFMNWDEDINEPYFIRQLMNYELLDDPVWYDWFVRHGGNPKLIEKWTRY